MRADTNDLQLEPTPLERATATAAAHYQDDAFFDAFVEGIAAAGFQDGIESNPYSEANEPVKWAGWHRGYWRATQTAESGS